MRKDALDFWLDRSKIAALLSPLFLAGLWFFISHFATGRPTTIFVYNPENSPLPQVVSSTFGSALITEATSPDEVSAAFGISGTQKSSPYNMGLIVPSGFEQQLHTGGHPKVTLYIDDATVDTQQRVSVLAVITNYAWNVAEPIPPLSLDTELINPGTTASKLTLGKFYSLQILPVSFIVGLALMPGLFIEEKEKKTLQWLLVTPANLSDILVGKTLVVTIYQLGLSVALLALMGGFTGDIPMVLLFTLLGALLALTVGLLIGSIFQTASTAATISSIAILVFILPCVILPLGPSFGNNPITNVVKVLPPYYFADGVYSALQQVGTASGNLLDAAVLAVSTIIVFLLTVWVLHRQASVTGAI
jgi:ABC-2 type transport system permease protein